MAVLLIVVGLSLIAFDAVDGGASDSLPGLLDPLIVGLVLTSVGIVLLIRRHYARVPCVHCSRKIRADATVCRHCFRRVSGG